MRFRPKWLSGYWLALGITASITLCSLWLAVTGKLILYVHPRYIIFTVIMSVLAVLCVVADMALRPRTPRAGRRVTVRRALAGLLCLVLCAGLLVTKPAGLTSSAAEQRGINTGGLNVSSTPLTDLSSAGTAYEQFSIKEWVSLLLQTNDAALFDGKPADITGFVSPVPGNDPNVFYVARFVITCCAVDARPIGVPVYQPGWRSSYQPDQWLEVRGVFMQNPAAGSMPIVLNPQHVTPVSEPADPYVY